MGHLPSPLLAQREHSCHFHDSVQVLQGLANPQEHKELTRLAGHLAVFMSRCGLEVIVETPALLTVSTLEVFPGLDAKAQCCLHRTDG